MFMVQGGTGAKVMGDGTEMARKMAAMLAKWKRSISQVESSYSRSWYVFWPCRDVLWA